MRTKPKRATRRRHLQESRKLPRGGGATKQPKQAFLANASLHPLSSNRVWIGLATLFIAAFILYAASTPKTVMLEDDGLFITAAHTAGVTHPPGYPLYIALGWVASHLPIGSVAARIHFLSGVMGALTCSCIAFLVLRRTGNRLAALIAGASLAVSQHFWSQAIIADVYTTNTAILFLCLALTQEAAGRKDTRLWILAALAFGIGLANHWPLLILASPAVFAYAIGAKSDFWHRLKYLLPAVLLCAAAFYAWMVWRSHQSPTVNFLGPISSRDAMVDFIGRDIYAEVDTSVNASIVDKLQYLSYFSIQTILQLSPLGFLAALWGIAVTWRRGWKLGVLGEAAAFVASSFLLILLLGFDYEYLMVAVIRPYFLVPFGLLALWMGIGIDAMTRTRRIEGRAGAPLLVALYAVSVLVLGVWNGRSNYRPTDRFAENHARAILSLVERDGVLVIHGDGNVFPIAYLHYVENERPDIRLLTSEGMGFNDRLVDPSWSSEQKNTVALKFFNESPRPVHVLGQDAIGGFGQRHLGFLRVLDSSVEASRIQFEVREEAVSYFKRAFEMEITEDRWVRTMRNLVLRTYGQFLGYVMILDHPSVNRQTEEVLALAQENYWSLVGMAKSLLEHGEISHANIANKFLRKAQNMSTSDRGKRDVSRELYLEGLAQHKLGNSTAAKARFIESLEIDRSPSNPAHRALE